jgi:hypothetical protein
MVSNSTRFGIQKKGVRYLDESRYQKFFPEFVLHYDAYFSGFM